MYRCQVCGTVVPPRTPCHRVAVRMRPASYPVRSEVNRVVRLVNGRHKAKYTDDPGGTGAEVVREVIACPRCANGRAAPPAG